MRLLPLSFLLFLACQQSATSVEQESIIPETTSSVHTLEVDSKSVIESSPVQTGETVFYAGQIGAYGPFVHLQIDREEEMVNGRYFYVKHQKMLILTGTVDAETGTYNMEETYEGELTGKWRFKVDDDGNLNGQWVSKPPSSNSLVLHARRVSSAASFAPQTPEMELYTYTFLNQMFNPTTQAMEEFQSENELKIGYLGADGFAFWYDVIGVNAHTGNLDGFAQMTGPNQARFEGEEGCVLNFRFDPSTTEVIIEEKDCEGFRGARAYFAGSLKKKVEE